MAVDPADATIGTGTTLNIGGASGSPEVGIYSTVPLHNLSVSGTGSPTAKVWLDELFVNGNLEINSTATFNANGFGLTIKGDFTNNGVFLHTNNTTTFDGTSTQTITGETTFYNLINLCSATLQLNDNIKVDNDLSLSDGVLSDQGNNVRVLGDVTIASGVEHIYGGVAGSSTQLGIQMNGGQKQSITGNGTFGKITIDNGSSVILPVGSTILIEDALRLKAGVFDIQGNLLELGLNCEIEGSGFNENRMIQTNVSFTDNGVKKTFPSGNSGVFLFPIGSVGKYTPVEFDITANATSTGTITVKAANEIHPSIINDTEASCQLDDANNVLQYHWILKSENISGFNATCTMYGDVSDIEVNNTCGLDATDYITARLLANNTTWNKFDETKFDETTAELTFDLIGNSGNIEGEYTAGLDDAIPNQVATYETIADGDWTNTSIWQPVPSSGPAVPVGGPRGCIAIINPAHTVDVQNDGEVYIYRGDINGTLNLNTTTKHRLGYVIGTGVLRMVDMNNLPAGDYNGTNGFITANGGTLEYAGTTNYNILSNISEFNSVTCSGSGERILPNIDITAFGDITISGADVVNGDDKNISIYGDFVMSSGTFDARTGSDNPIITFMGTQAQTINGNFTATNNSDLYNVVINKSIENVTLLSDVEISDNLSLTTGNFITSSANLMILNDAQTTVTGGSSSSFVDGPLRKAMDNLEDFTFPVGDGTRYGFISLIDVECSGTQYWTTEYFESAFGDLTVDAATLTSVSSTEHWKVNSPVDGNTAYVKLRWDPLSDINPTTVTGGYTDISVAEYDGTGPYWTEKASTNQTNNNLNGTVETSAAIPINTASNPQYYTLGSNSVVRPSITLGDNPQVCENSTTAYLSYTATTGDPLPNQYKIDYDDASFTDVTWTTLDGSPIELVIPATTGGPYTATITVRNSAPPATESIGVAFTVTYNPKPVAITGATDVCVGSNITLSHTTADGVWSSAFPGIATVATATSTTGTVTGVAAGTTDITYIVDGCASDPYEVTVNPLPAFTISGSAASVCDGDEFTLTTTFTTINTPYSIDIIKDGSSVTGYPTAVNISDNPYLYNENLVWTGPGVNNSFSYSVTIVDTNGCSDSSTTPVSVDVYKKPETGPQFHIPNDFGN